MSRNVQSNDNANISKYEYFGPPPPIYSPALYLPGFLLYGGVRCINTYYDNRKLTTAQRCENLNTLFFYMHMPFFCKQMPFL